MTASGPDDTAAEPPARTPGASPADAPADAPHRPWIAEHEVDGLTALALVRDAFPQLDATRIDPFGTGWDNTAWLVDGTWVFRFPRRQIAVDLLEAEGRVLPAIAPHLPLPIPCPEHRAPPSERFAWPFAGYRLLPGTTACGAALDTAARAALAEPLALFLVALHSLPAAWIDELDAPGDTLDRLALPRRRLAAAARLEEATHAGLLADPAPWLALLVDDAAPTPDWSPRTDRLVHGDLYARHVLVDATGAAAGVIDWGDVHRGEPALDLSLGYAFFPPGARRRFFDIYQDRCGAIDEATHRMARFKALLSAVTILVYGHDIGDADLAREGRLALDHLLRDA